MKKTAVIGICLTTILIGTCTSMRLSPLPDQMQLVLCLENGIQKLEKCCYSSGQRLDSARSVYQEQPTSENPPEDEEDLIRYYAEGTSVDADMAVAIARWETGHFTSDVFTEYNNYAGMNSTGEYYVYETKAKGAEAFVNMLDKYYFGIGLTTLEEIQPKFCPPGGTAWVEGVRSLL